MKPSEYGAEGVKYGVSFGTALAILPFPIQIIIRSCGPSSTGFSVGSA